MADERTLRTFDIGWGFFDIDLQACGEGEELNVEQGSVQEVSDKCDDIAEAKCSFCYDSGSITLSEEQQAEGQARFKIEVTHACAQHFEKHFVKYSFYNGKECCNPFGVHSKRVTTRLTLITLDMHKAKRSLIPGKKLCGHCLVRFQGETLAQEDGPQEEEEHEGSQGQGEHGGLGDTIDHFDSQASGPHEWSQDERVDTVNRAFDILSESPVKGYKVGNKTYVEEKISSLNKKIRDQLQVGSPEKDTDSDGFIASLKERFDLGDRDDKYRCLTLCPASWSSNKLSATFKCSRSMAISALELRAEHGPGSFPGKKQGRGLPMETIKKVTDFYLDQEFSRNLPGKKDVVMVRGEDGKRVAVQKRLFLSNLNEGYAAFKMQNPLINVGFSKFAELRPPQVVLSGQSGTHR